MEPIPLPPTAPLTFFGADLDLDGMAGTVALQMSDRHADFFVTDRVAVLFEQDLGPVGGRYACWMDTHKAVLEGAMAGTPAYRNALAAAAQSSIDRHLRPWTQHRVTPFPETITLVRSLAVAQAALAYIRRLPALYRKGMAKGLTGWDDRFPRIRPWRHA